MKEIITDAVCNPPVMDDIKAVFFDLDGSLVDSMWIWGDVDIDYLAKFGIERPDDLQRNIEGMSVVETALYFKKRFNISDSVEHMISVWNDMAFDKYMNDVFVKEGGLEFIDYCVKNNIKLGVCSSNSKTLLNAVLEKNGILDRFDIIVSGEDVNRGKPDPECYLKAAGYVNVEPSQCLVFEDLVKGIEAGNAAGMITCAVEDEYSRPQLEEKIRSADYFIFDYRSILRENV